MANPNRFEVDSIANLRKKYYAPNEKPPTLQLDPSAVPKSLRALIPLAEKWGISDDILRVDAVKASPNEIDDLRKVLAEYEDTLEAWLTGPESQKPKLTPEYLAFTNMLMASDGC